MARKLSRGAATALVLALGGLALPGRAGSAGQSDCGLVESVIPAFSLVDSNPASATLGDTYTRDALVGQVMLIYWAVAT